MKNIITIIFSVLYLSLWAQKPIIKVVDANTQEALPYVNICFESFDESQKLYAVTNIYGEVKNPCKDVCLVAISFVGYKTIIDTLQKSRTTVYKLVPDIFNLDQVVITATRTEKSLKDAPVITQVITAKDMENRGVSNVKDVLEEDIPGFEVQRGGFGSDIKMQGLDAKNILILIDGERLAGETGNNIDYSRLNTDNVERIEVVKGAASALYGSQAMGGVINIITKNARKKLEVSVSSKWAEMNELNYPDLKPSTIKYESKKNLDLQNYNINASIGFNLKQISGRTDISTKSFDAYQLYDKEPVTKAFSNIDTTINNALNPFPTGINGYKDYSFQQKLEIPIAKNLKLKLKGSYYDHDEFDFVPDNKYQNFIDVSYGAVIDYAISDKLSVVGSFHSDTYEKFYFFEKTGNKERNYRNKYLNPKLTVFSKIGKYQHITVGAEYLQDALLSDKFSKDNLQEKQSETSVIFIQDDINLNKNINFILGGRGDYHSAFGFHFSPKISTMYKLNKWAFRINYANGFRSPTVKELYMEWPIAWFTIRGDENLKPETNNYLSASVEYTKDWLNISGTFYKNWLKNKIDGVWRENQTVYQYVNVSDVELTGLELLLKAKVFRHFIVSGAYSYIHDKRPQGELVSSTSPHTGNLKLSYQFIHKKYELNLNLSSTLLGAKNYEVSEQVLYRGEYVEGIYPVHFDAYSLWKLAVSQRFINGVNLTIGIDNVFNYTANVVSFNTSISPGRKAFVSLKIDIDKIIKSKNN